MYDITIIGAGAAGLTAAIYAMRAGKTVLILEKETFGGQITSSPKVENYPGFEEISGSELGDKLMDQAVNHGAEVEMDTALEVLDNNGTKTVKGEYGTYESKALIIAAGSKHRHLGLDREDDFVGKGISYCATCDGAFYAGKTVAVIGGGNSALQEAVFLSSYCKEVIIVQNLAFCTGEPRLLDLLESKENVRIIYNSIVSELIGDDTLSAIEITDTQSSAKTQLSLNGIFVAIGQVPENDAFESLCPLSQDGYIVADESCITKTPGVFAAGDCRTKQIRQLVTATGDGAVAAVAACKYIDSL